MKKYTPDLDGRQFISIRCTGKKKVQMIYDDLINTYPVEDIVEIIDKEVLIEIITNHEYNFAVRDLVKRYPEAKIDGFTFDATARNGRRWFQLWRIRRF